MILKNCRLVPELSQAGAPQDADVIISGNRIEAILPAGSAPESEDSFSLDLKGKTLLPGLIDAHVHLFMGKRSGGFTLGDRDMIPARWAFDSYDFARWFLDYGYTTVRDCGDEKNYSGLAVRSAVNDGIVKGPRIFGSGLTIVPYTAGFDTSAFMCGFYSTAEDVRRVARDQFYHGADFLKIYGTGSMNVEDSKPGKRIMMKDEIAEAVRTAELRGSYVAAHCHGAEACDVMVDLGVRTIEHASFITEETCRKLDGRRDAGIVPTIAVSTPLAHGLKEGDPGYELKKKRCDDRDACIMNAYLNHDILIGWGTDMSVMQMEERPFCEWQERKRLGFSNIDMLKQATIDSAVLICKDDIIGSIETGKLADMIVVDGDPVSDISAMYKKPEHVIKDGELIR